ncbi:hypothetical protein FIBSPDRAFT_948280 [Athelia psychrophila]|uniref:Uncharacterized protein n=1 Tax=Athelia psychrophila TaxID=1759441 RepID=A0A166QY83_9AGAM|nr:hypothetical protein FIBSPDRAFT_948280 [Fibularhizoctonia sp. CBS 109695]
MQFFKSPLFAALAFVAFVAAAPSTLETRDSNTECKALLQSCSVNSACCNDLCVLGLCL